MPINKKRYTPKENKNAPSSSSRRFSKMVDGHFIRTTGVEIRTSTYIIDD